MKKTMLFLLFTIMLSSFTLLTACDIKDSNMPSGISESGSATAPGTASTSSNQNVETYTVTIEVNEPSFGSVSKTIVENVAKGADIIINGDKLTIGETIITATSADETDINVYSFEKWSAPEKVVSNVKITAYFKKNAKIPTDSDNYKNMLYVDDGEDFVILNFTDFQLHDGKSTYATFSIIDELVAEVKPNLITVLGDTAEDNGDNKTKKTFKSIVDHIDSLGIPWAPIYGNHDNDSYRENNSVKDVTSEWINDTFLSADNCLFKVGPDDVNGNGNYVVNIVNKSTNKIVKTLIFVDTGINGVDSTHVAFYENAINDCKNLNDGDAPESIVFTHIPLPEYKIVYDSGDFEGIAGESPSTGSGTSEFFRKIKEHGSTTHVICGHDYVNSFYANYQGVYLMYCLKSSDGDYYNENQLGGTVFTIGDETTFEYKYKKVAKELIAATDYDIPELDNFKNSGKALSFRYKPTTAINSGKDIAFTIWEKGWNKRITDLVYLDVENNSVNGAVGIVEALDDGWYKVKINCKNFTINIAEGATGSETAGLLYFNSVKHSVLLDEISFINPDIRDDAVMIAKANEWFNFEEELPAFAASDKALSFDYKAIEKESNTGNDFSFTLWGKNWAPPRLTDIMTVDVVNNKSSIGNVKELEDGWYRVVIPAKQLPINTLEHATGTETIGSFIFYEVKHAILIDEVGFIEPDIRDDALEISEANQWFDFEEGLNNFASSGKALVFDYKAVDKDTNSGNTFVFTLWGTGWSPVRRTELITVDVVNNTVSVGNVKELEDGWYRVTIFASELPINTEEGATGDETLGSFIFNEVNHAVLIDEVRFVQN